MKWFRMRNYTINAVVKACILLGFAVFFFLSIQNGRVYNFVHPRNIPVLQFAIIFMLICAVFLFKEAFKPQRRLRSSCSLWIFIIPLVGAFFLPGETANAVSMTYANFSPGGSVGGDLADKELTSNGSEKGIDENTTYDEEAFYKEAFSDMFGENTSADGNDMIIVDTENYVTWMDDIYDNLEKYQGRKIQLTGFVYKEPQYEKNQFVSARLMMVCCAADIQTIGFLCSYENAAVLEADDWVRIEGTIEEGQFEGNPLAMVAVEKITPTEEPERSFVYPF